jgi:hypothetical protein
MIDSSIAWALLGYFNANQTFATTVAPHQFETRPPGLGDKIDPTARLRAGIAGKDKAVFLGEIGVVVAQGE